MGISQAGRILHFNYLERLRMHFKVSQIPVPPTLSLENFAKLDNRLEEDMVRSYVSFMKQHDSFEAP